MSMIVRASEMTKPAEMKPWREGGMYMRVRENNISQQYHIRSRGAVMLGG